MDMYALPGTTTADRKRSRVFSTAFVILALASAACGGGGGTPTAPAPAATRIVSLSGNLAFGSVTVGQQSSAATLTISNTGNSPLTISGMLVPGGAYSASWQNGTIAAGASQAVTIRFAPTAAADYTGVLTVNGDQTSGTNTVAISGIAGPDGGTVAKPVGTVCFGFVFRGEVSTERLLFTGDRQQVRQHAIDYALRQSILLLTAS